METVTATKARSQLYRMIDSAGDEPVLIAGKRNNAVLVAEDDWKAIQETSLPPLRPRHARIDPPRPENPRRQMQSGAQVVSWRLVYTTQAQKDAKKLAASSLKPKAQLLLAVIERNPFQNAPPYEKLVGDLAGAYSRRINIQHRLVYQVLEEVHTVKVLRMWTHYE